VNPQTPAITITINYHYPLTSLNSQLSTLMTVRSRLNLSSWIYLAPATLFFVGYMLYPILRALWMSFTDYRFLRIAPANFIGLANYEAAIVDPLFQIGLVRAAQFSLLFIPGMIGLPLLVAVLVDGVKNRVLSTLYRVILLIPAVIPGPMIFVLWRWLYNYEIGPINYILVDVLGLFEKANAPQFVGNPNLVQPAVAFFEWWWGLGYHTMFFLAGLAAIPKDLYEAAEIDGATPWQVFWNVTLPRLRPIMAVLVVLRFGTSMAVIDEYLIYGGFNRGLPTYTWSVYMYDLAFQIGEWLQGYAAAIGWLGAIGMLIVTAVLLWLFRNRDG
jgi:multiple sugar transport system permease protein